MTPIVKVYSNDEEVEVNINTLKDQQINAKDVFVLSHDPDRTERIVNHTEVSGIDYNRSTVVMKWLSKEVNCVKNYRCLAFLKKILMNTKN